MSIFKCKMCGGDLEIAAGMSVAECQYCGTKQTLPKLDDEKRANLYDRANHFRRNNEFDKAMGIYEQILNEDGNDAEAYWSLVLCRYGIEYVEDPATHKRVPTVNRAQYTSIFADADYKSAIEHADGYQKSVYEEEAKAIDEIQKGILAISSLEGIYQDAGSRAKSARTEAEYITAANLFRFVKGYKDADKHAATCAEKAETARKDAIKENERRVKLTKKIAVIGTPIVVVVIAFLIILNTVIIPSVKYNKAVKLYGEEMVNSAKNLKVGDVFKFGAYEQDNNTSNGKEPIEWQVLDKQGNKALLISKYALDCQKYNTSRTDVTWESCTLRQWLNNDFYNAAFDGSQQAAIATTTVTADKNPKYAINPGRNTEDKVFLLSTNEAEKYFTSDGKRQCAGTAYAYAQGAYKGDNGNCWWWLRSPGSRTRDAADVDTGGAVYYLGSNVSNSSDAVRPALWIDLES